jgi:hypothetical protein
MSRERDEEIGDAVFEFGRTVERYRRRVERQRLEVTHELEQMVSMLEGQGDSDVLRRARALLRTALEGR